MKPAFSSERCSARFSTSVDASTRLTAVSANRRTVNNRWATPRPMAQLEVVELAFELGRRGPAVDQIDVVNRDLSQANPSVVELPSGHVALIRPRC